MCSACTTDVAAASPRCARPGDLFVCILILARPRSHTHTHTHTHASRVAPGYLPNLIITSPKKIVCVRVSRAHTHTFDNTRTISLALPFSMSAAVRVCICACYCVCLVMSVFSLTTCGNSKGALNGVRRRGILDVCVIFETQLQCDLSERIEKGRRQTKRR